MQEREILLILAVIVILLLFTTRTRNQTKTIKTQLQQKQEQEQLQSQQEQLVQSKSASTVYENAIKSLVTMVTRVGNQYFGGSGFFAVTGNSSLFDINQYLYLVTAAHIVTDNESLVDDVWIIDNNLNVYKLNSNGVVLLGYDNLADVAFIRIPRSLTNSNIPHLEFKNSRTELKIGENVNVLGFPLADDVQSITRGIVRDNKFTNSFYAESVLTDANTYGGNSGGPGLTDDGKCIGVTSWGLQDSIDGYNGLSASNHVIPIFERFVSGSGFQKGFLGIRFRNVTPFDIPIRNITTTPMGVIVLEIVKSSPSLVAAVSVGDIITRVNNVIVGMFNNQSTIFNEIHFKEPNSTVSLTVMKYNSISNSYGPEQVFSNVLVQEIDSAQDLVGNNVRKLLKIY